MSKDGWRSNQKIFIWGNFLDQEEHQTRKDFPHIRSLYCPITVTAIACGSQHILLLNHTGAVYGMGDNRYGQLGRPSQQIGIPLLQRLEVGSCSIRQVACGARHSILIDENSTAYGCGEGQHGAVGHGSLVNSYEVVRVGIGIRKVVCGARHTVAINDYGRVYGWGDCSQGQLGLTEKSSQKYLRPTSLGECEVNEVAAFDNITLFLRRGEVFGCGGNHLGQLGVGHKRSVLSPTPIPLPKEVVKMCAGRYSICQTKGKQTYFFGSGVFGELLLPVKIDLKGAENIFQSDSCSFAATSDGTVFGWGCNLHGQLLEPPEVKGRHVPTEIPFLRNFSKLSCGNNYVVGVAQTLSGKSLQGFLDTTGISAEDDSQVTMLRRQNTVLREKVKQLSILIAERGQSQVDINEILQQYQRLQRDHSRLGEQLHETKKSLELANLYNAKLKGENVSLYRAVAAGHQQLKTEAGMQFHHAKQLIAVYSQQSENSRLEAARQRQLLAKAQSHCTILLDLLYTSDFMHEFFEARTEKKNVTESSREEIHILFSSLATHTSKLREIVRSLG